MAQVSTEIGVLAVRAKRVVEERLPKALAVKETVDRAEVLNELDLAFLEPVVTDADAIRLIEHENPQALEAL